MPFARGDSLRTITEGLAWVVKTCELQGLLKLFDNHVLAQHFFCRLLNTVYRLQLKQMDLIQANHPAIDLGDSANRAAYQITTEKRGEKVQDTLDKFVAHKFPVVYDVLRILVIGERQATYKTVAVPAGLIFDCDRDILGIPELLKYIETLETAHLEEVTAVFQEELVKARPSQREVPTPDLMPEAQEMLIDACAAEGGEKGKIVWTLVGDGWVIRSGTTAKHILHQDREAQARWRAALEQLEGRKLVELAMTRTGLGGNLLGWYTVRHDGYLAAGKLPHRQTTTYTVTSIGQQGGVTAGVVNVGPSPRHIDDVVRGQLLHYLPEKALPVTIMSVMGDGEALAFATQIRDFLVAQGYQIGGFSQAVFPGVPEPQHLNPDTRTIVIGNQQR